MQIKEVYAKPKKSMDPVKFSELITKMKKEHEKLCKGMFEFLDAQGGWFEFTYKWFKDDPIRTIKIQHGEICELPMGIVKHINNTKRKIRKFDMVQLPDGSRGIPQGYEVQSRVRFTPMDVL